MVSLFPCRHPDQLRIAQSVAMVRQSRSNAAFIMCMMSLALAAQLRSGFGWLAFIWQMVMGAIACSALASWVRLSRLPAPASVSERHIRNATISAVVCGVMWGLGLFAWTSPAEPQLALMALAVSATCTVHAVAAGYFVPWAVIGFATPVIAGTVVVCLATLEAPVARVGVLLIALHCLAAFRQLRTNWNRFAHAIDLDVERSRLSAMLQEQKDIAEKAVQQKTRFLASASHDLRQPMHAISLYLDGLAEIDVPPRLREVIADARVCAHDMNDMFRSLLDMSRLDSHQAVPALSVFGIDAILSRVEKEFSPLAASRGISLRVRPCAGHVYSDPVMVERIALNFVSNAVRHTHEGGVLVACRMRGRVLRLAVYDTGHGIPESEQQIIFEEFKRLEAAGPRDDTGGLGLGLAIVRRLAQALRLPVVVRSTPGRGSMFGVDLPLVHTGRDGAKARIADSKLAGRLIVVVDDEPSILQAASFILESVGCHVVSARSGREAMVSLASSARVPDAIVCDFELKDAIGGANVIRDLREEFNCEIPALLVTGNTVGGKAEKSARELSIPVLYKPLEAVTFRMSLEELLSVERQ